MSIQSSVYTPNYSIGPYFQIGGTSVSFSIGTGGISFGVGGQVSVGAAISGTSAIGWDWSGNSSIQPSVMAGVGVPTGVPGPTGSFVSTLDGLSQQLQVGIGVTDLAEVGISVTRTQPDPWGTYPSQTSNESARLDNYPGPWDSYPNQTSNETARLDPNSFHDYPNQTPNETSRLDNQPNPWDSYPDETSNETERLNDFQKPGEGDSATNGEQLGANGNVNGSLAAAFGILNQVLADGSDMMWEAASVAPGAEIAASWFDEDVASINHLFSQMAAQESMASQSTSTPPTDQAAAGDSIEAAPSSSPSEMPGFDFDPYSYGGEQLQNLYAQQIAAPTVM